jgi:hypothetical protein
VGIVVVIVGRHSEKRIKENQVEASVVEDPQITVSELT